ncbi:MAG TPA: serine/threonine-protein kinase, partial [Verrucomicrobiae bacterium]|nr:serine/threonine-protein kinase [Verrucomicrobiae bacterium]
MDAGDSLLHYTIHSRLGEGGMGVVYRAEDGRLGRTVALKILRPDLAANQEWERRFQREVRAASAVNHPGIATIYDVHRDGTTVFYTMEFVEGKNLRSLLQGGPLPLPLLLRAGLQITEAMTEAHRRGIVHRDLKPENVVLSDGGFFKVLDFGLACFVTDALVGPEARSRLETITRDTTGGGRVIGTVSYMSPEQAQGLPVDARSDLFSIGVLLHELATGVSPFTRASVLATFHAIVHEASAPVRSLRPELPEELEWILGRCLAKDPGNRYPTAAELAEDLRALAGVSGSGARKISSIRRFGPEAASRRRWPVVVAAAAAG